MAEKTIVTPKDIHQIRVCCAETSMQYELEKERSSMQFTIADRHKPTADVYCANFDNPALTAALEKISTLPVNRPTEYDAGMGYIRLFSKGDFITPSEALIAILEELKTAFEQDSNVSVTHPWMATSFDHNWIKSVPVPPPDEQNQCMIWGQNPFLRQPEQPSGTASQPIERLAYGLLGPDDDVMLADGRAWSCSKCRRVNTRYYCECGARLGEGVPPLVLFPAAAENVWECSCGHKETTWFCSNCGKPRPKT